MPVISAVLPLWCEAREIGQSLRATLAIADEVVIVDAGSPDGTAGIAERAGARVVQAAKRRRIQLTAEPAQPGPTYSCSFMPTPAFRTRLAAPSPGTVKTRLCDVLGARGAELARVFISDAWSYLAGLDWAEPILGTTAPATRCIRMMPCSAPATTGDFT
jgi:glycosyltransferase involved in cell wall biosynthesis